MSEGGEVEKKLEEMNPEAEAEPKLVNGLTLDERYDLVRSIGEECIKEDELRRLLEKKPLPVCYDGFEPSGRMHIAQGVMKALNVNKLTKAGCVFKFWTGSPCSTTRWEAISRRSGRSEST